MKHLKLYENYFLNELFVHGDKDVEGKWIIQYKADVWVLDEDSYEQYQQDIAEKTNIDEEDYWDFMRIIEEEKNYIFKGRIESPYLVIPARWDMRHSKLSPDVRKVMQQFDLTDIKTEYVEYVKETDVEGYETPEKDLKSATFYHGTCVAMAPSICLRGLAPRAVTNTKSNYPKVEHSDRVFITLNREKAYSHAVNAAGKQNSFPMIIELRVPDVSKLDLDYDVAIQHLFDDERTKSLGFRDIADNTEHTGSNSGVPNVNNKLGIYSYQGRIPATFITAIRLDGDGYEAFASSRHYEHSFDFEENHECLEFNIDNWLQLTPSEVQPYLDQVKDSFDEIDEEDEDDWNEDEE